MLNLKNYKIMKNLNELKQNCTLIAEFNNPAFVPKKINEINIYRRKTKIALYGDNKGRYYLYKYINDSTIMEFLSYEMAIYQFTRFIDIILKR